MFSQRTGWRTERDERTVIQACVIARHVVASVSVRPVSSAQPKTRQKYPPPRSLQLLVSKKRGRLARDLLNATISRGSPRWNLNAVFDFNIARYESRNRLADDFLQKRHKGRNGGVQPTLVVRFSNQRQRIGSEKNSKSKRNSFGSTTDRTSKHSDKTAQHVR